MWSLHVLFVSAWVALKVAIKSLLVGFNVNVCVCDPGLAIHTGCFPACVPIHWAPAPREPNKDKAVWFKI